MSSNNSEIYLTLQWHTKWRSECEEINMRDLVTAIFIVEWKTGVKTNEPMSTTTTTSTINTGTWRMNDTWASVKIDFSKLGKVSKKTFFWDFVPNIRPHPPTAHVWDSTKWKIKVKFNLLFRLFRAFYFFEKMSNFSDKIPSLGP